MADGIRVRPADEQLYDVQNSAKQPPSSDTRKIFKNSVALAQYSFLLQIILRAITFILNGLAFRRLDVGLMGIVNFRLALYYSTLVFAARESFRRACLSRGGEILIDPLFDKQRSSKQARKRLWYGLFNVMWLTIPVGLLLILLLLPIWLFVWPSPAEDKSISNQMVPPGQLDQQYFVSCLIFSISALLELATEPFWLLCQLCLLVRERIALEALANIARASGVIIAVLFVPNHFGLYLLTGPQLLHGSSLLLGYVILVTWMLNFKKENSPLALLPIDSISDILPCFSEISFDWECLQLSWNFFRQGILKQFLTEGERYLISAFHLLSFVDQGIYDLVNNLGSLAARMLFNPVEESCHLLFSQCIQRENQPHQQNEHLLMQALNMLKISLRLLTLLAWVGCVFGQSYSRLLLFLYGGASLSDQSEAVNLLRLFSFYLVFLAWNGPTEAFLNAAMTSDEVNVHNRRLTVFSVLFLASTWLLVPRFGAAGFVLANCVNIFARVVYSFIFLHRFIDDVTIRKGEKESELFSASTLTEVRSFSLIRLMLPTQLQALIFLVAAAATITSEIIFCSEFTLWRILAHISIGTTAFLVILVAICRQERHLFASLSETGLGKRLAPIRFLFA